MPADAASASTSSQALVPVSAGSSAAHSGKKRLSILGGNLIDFVHERQKMRVVPESEYFAPMTVSSSVARSAVDNNPSGVHAHCQ